MAVISCYHSQFRFIFPAAIWALHQPPFFFVNFCFHLPLGFSPTTSHFDRGSRGAQCAGRPFGHASCHWLWPCVLQEWEKSQRTWSQVAKNEWTWCWMARMVHGLIRKSKHCWSMIHLLHSKGVIQKRIWWRGYEAPCFFTASFLSWKFQSIFFSKSEGMVLNCDRGKNWLEYAFSKLRHPTAADGTFS